VVGGGLVIPGSGELRSEAGSATRTRRDRVCEGGFGRRRFPAVVGGFDDRRLFSCGEVREITVGAATGATLKEKPAEVQIKEEE
ncbi:hypothetical protein U1Q18_029905, partial [Sarracenia purpurea var. burkii]